MAYKYTYEYTLQELTEMSPDRLMNMGEPAFREALRRMTGAANRRLSRLKRSTPAKRQAERGGGRFSTAGKDITGLRNEFIRAKGFLKDPTSTNSGQTGREAEVAAKLADAGWTVDEADIPQMLALFDTLTRADGDVLTRGERYKYLRQMADVLTPGDGDEHTGQDILNDLATALAELGIRGDSDESENAEAEYDTGVSRFFDLI